jgi:endonuclease/exonuclease/phosphatase family metal-dependent hydrolase
MNFPARFVLIISAALSLTAPRALASGAGQRLKILQLNFNDEIVPFDDRKSAMRDLRFAVLVAWIEAESPDLVFIEEGWDYHGAPSLAIPLAQAVGYDQFYRIGEGLPFILYDSNVILAKKKFEMSDTRETTLPHSAPHLGDGIHDYIALGSHSDVVGARLTLDDGEPLFVYDTHMLGSTAQDRGDQANGVIQAIAAQLKDYGLDASNAHVLLAGDMNADPSEPAIQNYLGAGFIDSWSQAHPDHANDSLAFTNCGDPVGECFNPLTLGSNQFPAQNTYTPDVKIDYIFGRGPDFGTLASTLVFTHPYSGFWMSDHFGVLSTVTIGQDSGPPVPNPLNDGAPDTNTQLVEVTDAEFASCKKGQVCSVSGATLAVGARGLTVVNNATGDVSVTVKGTAAIWPTATAKLEVGQIASFVFPQGGTFEARLKGKGRKLKAELQATAPE